MKCPVCKNSMKKKKPYPVQGQKHGIPGFINVYFCKTCNKNVRFFEVLEPKYFKMRDFLGRLIKEEQAISRKSRSKLRDFERDLSTGSTKRQGENLLKVLASFIKRLP